MACRPVASWENSEKTPKALFVNTTKGEKENGREKSS